MQLGWLRAASQPEEVLSFYRSAPDPFLLPRPERDFRLAVERGQHFIVGRGPRIEAAAGVFDYGHDLPFVELSETRVSDPLRGFGLQRLFLLVRVASVVAFQGPGVLCTCAVDPGNTRSLANVESVGFRPWNAPPPEALASCPECPRRPVSGHRRCCCDFYALPVEQARGAVGAFLAQTAGGVLTLSARLKGTLKLDCSSCLVATDSEVRSALGEFASGSSW